MEKKKRPESLKSTTYQVETGSGTLYVIISSMDNKPFEMFCSIGKSGFSTMANAEAIGRLVSLCLQNEISTTKIIKQLEGIGGSEPSYYDGVVIQSIPDGIAQILKKHINKK